jgi:hypothetical protein
LHILESISKCTETDDSGCDSCVINRGNHFCDVAAFHWRRGDRQTNPNFLPAFAEYMLTMPLQASRFVKAELTKRNISVLYLATNSGKMDEVRLMHELLHPIRIYSSVSESADWRTAIIRAVSDMVIASHAGFFIMGPGLRGSHLQSVSTFSRRIMLQRIHHLGLSGGSHFAVCCGDLTSIKITSPKDGTVYQVSESLTTIDVTAVVLNPLKDSDVYAVVHDSIGSINYKMSILPHTGRIIQSGRVLDRDEPDNIAHMWGVSISISARGKCFITASANTLMQFFLACFFFSFSDSFMQVLNAQGDRIDEFSAVRSEIFIQDVDTTGKNEL